VLNELCKSMFEFDCTWSGGSTDDVGRL